MRKSIYLICLFVYAMIVNAAYAADEITEKNDVIIFVSFSMPSESIKGWMREAEKIRAPLVIRGLVDNSFKKTIHKMSELVVDNRGGVQLNPLLFTKYNIKQVPAVVVNNGYDFDVVYGDVHLPYALKMIANKKDALSAIANHALIQFGANVNV